MEANDNKTQMIRSKNYTCVAFNYGDEYFFNMKNDSEETVNLTSETNIKPVLNHHHQRVKRWIPGL